MVVLRATLAMTIRSVPRHDSKHGIYCFFFDNFKSTIHFSFLMLKGGDILIISFIFLLVLSACAPPEAKLVLTLRPPKGCSGTFAYSVALTDTNNDGLEGRWVKVSIDGEEFERLKTDQNGRFSSSGDMRSEWCNKEIMFTAAVEGLDVSAVQPLSLSACDDGTGAESCSGRAGYYCTDKAKLVSNCEKCGCASGLTCSGNECVTAEVHSSQLIAQLQKSIVKVNHTWAGGSGIVIKQDNTRTFILTNSHVVEAAFNISDVRVFPSSGSGLSASRIYVAPDNIDLAVIEVLGEIGVSTEIAYANSSRGQSVVALGSPLGFQGSVSKGIISNFIPDTTRDSNYSKNHIQTDAAINPGNSGGGLFLENDGRLIGINTYKYGDTEGLGFAIDIRELKSLPAYDEWPVWSKQPGSCVDGTPEGYCSLQLPWGCFEGRYIPACQSCGCPEDQYCTDSGSCNWSNG